MTAELPNNAIWYATGNNVRLRGDAVRRVLLCRLESTEERPEERSGFAIPDLLRHVREHRAELVRDCLTILRAHAVAGRPVARSLTPFGSFEVWSEVVRAAVHWTVGHDPCATRKALRDQDPQTQELAAVVAGLVELPGASSPQGLTAAEILEHVRDNPRSYEMLRTVLLGWSRTSDLPSPGSLGKRLGALRGRVSDGRAVKLVPDTKVQRWAVGVVTPGAPGDPPTVGDAEMSKACRTNPVRKGTTYRIGM